METWNGLSAAEAIAVEADARWDELEAGCRFPDDLYRGLAGAGVFTQLVPAESGGAGRSPCDTFDLGMELARYNGSLGWIASQGAAMMALFYSLASPGLRDAVLGDPLVRLAGVNTAVGRFRTAGDGVEISGRWPFTSGCEGSSWCVVLLLPDGSNDRGELRMACVRADQYRVDRDWDPDGLRGTGSHSIVVTGEYCPSDYLFDINLRSTLEHPVACASPAVGGPWPISASVAATQLGLARRALDEATVIVDSKAPAPTFTPLRSSHAVQRELSRLEGLWWAAQAGMREALTELWEAAISDGVSLQHRRKVPSATTRPTRPQGGL